MKKLVIAMMLAMVAVSASADGGRGRNYNNGNNYHGRHYNNGSYHGGNWIVPLAIGGTIGYWLNQPREVYVAPPPPPVYIEQQPVRQFNRTCTRFITQDSFGNVIREETRCN